MGQPHLKFKNCPALICLERSGQIRVFSRPPLKYDWDSVNMHVFALLITKLMEIGASTEFYQDKIYEWELPQISNKLRKIRTNRIASGILITSLWMKAINKATI